METVETIRNRYDAGEKLEFIFFWGHHQNGTRVTQACLSQWYPAQFVIDDITYRCTEQWMMAEKARVFGDEYNRKKILEAKDPKEMKSLGRQVRNFNADVWNEKAREIVTKGNIAKFSQNPGLKAFLLNTRNMVLVEASPYDKIWGIGLDRETALKGSVDQWQGENLLGCALMEVRDWLRTENL